MSPKDILDGVSVLRWLTSQRNANGGYSSTQDTVLAIQAMGAFAEEAFSPDFDINVVVKNGQKSQSYQITPDNAIVLNIYEIPDVFSPVEIEASGSGIAFAQVNWNYHTVSKLRGEESPFNCTLNVRKVADANRRIQVETCCNLKMEGETNMALMEIQSLSGHQIDGEELQKLTKLEDFQRVDLTKGGTQAQIYLNKVTQKAMCFTIATDKVFDVADQMGASFSLMDYYSPDKQFLGEYSVEGPSLAESCVSCWQHTV